MSLFINPPPPDILRIGIDVPSALISFRNVSTELQGTIMINAF